MDRNPLLKTFASTIDIDDVAVIREGVNILSAQGRKRIALLSWCTPPSQPNSPGQTANVLRSALDAAGLEYHPEWVRGNLPPVLPGAGWEEFRDLWTARTARPDGLIVGDDVLFDDARKAIVEMGIRVPEQLAIVTHANKGSNISHPFPVTRIEFDPLEFARTMVDQLDQRLAGRTPEHPHICVPYRVLAASSSVPGADIHGPRASKKQESRQ